MILLAHIRRDKNIDARGLSHSAREGADRGIPRGHQSSSRDLELTSTNIRQKLVS